ncbi:MAG TPA: glutamine--tRNA ligase/YqeY domain fusion protein [Clostridia bacterium]
MSEEIEKIQDGKPVNFIHEAIIEDLESKRYKEVHTRFPPEPNGYLHIGHAKAICIDFGTALRFSGKCNLRFDDTNPSKEDTEYVDSIMEDVKWLGFDWEDRLYYASDIFEKMYECAVELIKRGKAYVCDLTADEIRKYRGTLTQPGEESPYVKRSVEENLDLFKRMRAGEFPDGSKVLRARIDMASPNINMRDPVIYRILRAHHHRTGDNWCIYPMYDFAHPLEDYYEGVTHSLCSLEFEDHRPLYDWVLISLGFTERPRQIEFARLNLTYTMMSKRKLLALVKDKHVSGWDDPRMPTLSGLRRRGYTSSAVRDFADRIGVAKTNSLVDIALLEHCIREELNLTSNRVMAVLRPVKLIIDNYPDGQVEEFEAENNPEDPDAGVRKVSFSKVLYIEADDFMENPTKGYFRMFPGSEVRLKHAYIVKCESFIKNENGDVVEIHCTYDPSTRGGNAPEGKKIKGTIHWASDAHAVDAEVRLYDNLFSVPNPGETEGRDFTEELNPASLEVLKGCKVEPVLAASESDKRYQFLRLGYFWPDPIDSKEGHLVFNRIVALKDTWAKQKGK